ncbi:MAG: acyltransferase [Thermodesulfobacteriota bacterium]
MQDIPQRNNFDLLRLVLALTVCLAHLGEVTGVQAFGILARYFYSGPAVDCFFVVSGFLIFRSFHRSSSIHSYLDKRIRRIYPAYLAVILISALLLPLLAAHPVVSYLSFDWLKYLGANLIFLNFLEPNLPGVFINNPLQPVNGSLWTIKIEVLFYLSVPLIALLYRRRSKIRLFVLLYILSVTYSTILLALWQKTHNPNLLLIEKQLPGQLAFFLSGGLLYFYYPVFSRFTYRILLLGVIGMGIHLKFVIYPLYPISLAVLVVFFTLKMPFLGNWGRFGDISYGVYIYHFPLVQTLTVLGFFTLPPKLSFGLLLILLFFISYSSYHLVEKPFLKKSSHYRLSENELSTG